MKLQNRVNLKAAEEMSKYLLSCQSPCDIPLQVQKQFHSLKRFALASSEGVILSQCSKKPNKNTGLILLFFPKPTFLPTFIPFRHRGITSEQHVLGCINDTPLQLFLPIIGKPHLYPSSDLLNIFSFKKPKRCCACAWIY